MRSVADPLRTHRMDDAPLRSKVALLVVAGVLVGIFVQVLSSEFGNAVILGRQVPSVILAVLGFLVTGSALIMVGQWWIASPYDRLVKQIDKVADRRHVTDLSALPLTRRDEAGRIARAMHRVTTVAIRDGREARQLRRSLDRKVQDQIRRATAQLRRLALRDALTELGRLEAALATGTEARRSFESLDEPELAATLIRAGNDVNAADVSGTTALHVAAEHGHSALVEFLLRNRADRTRRNREGKTPLDLARTAEKTEVVELLKPN